MARSWIFEIEATNKDRVSFLIRGPGGNHTYPARPLDMEPDDIEAIAMEMIREAGKAREMEEKRPKIRSAS
jgi:hypothetical protein